jgi:hypothetical protein
MRPGDPHRTRMAEAATLLVKYTLVERGGLDGRSAVGETEGMVRVRKGPGQLLKAGDVRRALPFAADAPLFLRAKWVHKEQPVVWQDLVADDQTVPMVEDTVAEVRVLPLFYGPPQTVADVADLSSEAWDAWRSSRARATGHVDASDVAALSRVLAAEAAAAPPPSSSASADAGAAGAPPPIPVDLGKVGAQVAQVGAQVAQVGAAAVGRAMGSLVSMFDASSATRSSSSSSSSSKP